MESIKNDKNNLTILFSIPFIFFIPLVAVLILGNHLNI